MNGETRRWRDTILQGIKLSLPLRLSVQFLLAWTILSATPLQAQHGLGFSLHTGPLLKINPVYPETSQMPYFGEICYMFPNHREKLWQKVHPYLRISLSTHILNLGNPEVLGLGLGQTVDLNIPLWTIRQKLVFSLKHGSGLGYISKPYDRISNPGNNAIGSRINNLTRIGLQVDWVGSGNLIPYATFSYTHFSNSRVRVPNLGLNYPAVGLGVRYRTKPIKSSPISALDFPLNQHFLSVRLGWGATTVPASNGPVYPVYVGAIAYNRTLPNLRFRWKVGVESFVSYASYAILKDYDQPFPQTAWNATGIIVFAGGELLLGRFSSVTHLGPYVKTAFQMKYVLYTKLGVKYHLFNQDNNPRHQPFIGVYMHAHSGESDFLECGLGWNF